MKPRPFFHKFLHLVAHLAPRVWATNDQRVANSGDKLLYNVQLQKCPRSCEFSGPDPAGWTSYQDLDELRFCDQTVLFCLNVHNPLLDPATHALIKACSTASGGPRVTVGESVGAELGTSAASLSHSQPLVANLTTASFCGAAPSKVTATARMAWSGNPRSDTGSASSAASALARYVRETAGCGASIMLALDGNAVVGAIVGGDLVKSAAASLIDTAETQLGSQPPGQLAFELCQGGGIRDHSSLDARLGIFADLQGNVSSVQDALRIWSTGGCLELDALASAGPDGGDRSINTEVSVLTSPFKTDDKTKARGVDLSVGSALGPRADCRAIQVVSGDSCSSLAVRCGISGNDFTKYNSYNSQLCSTLKVKQWVCCSAGTVPDMRPKPNTDGKCATYTIGKDDGCWAIADTFGITQANIEQYNKQTWGWTGCSSLMQGQVICLSTGEPPMPAVDSTAICGPQVVGTKRPANWADITKLNPCPLNACCNIWGMCGTTSDFCTMTPADTGAPGTARPGTNGCISNCLTDIVNNKQPPWFFFRVGYFEGWNAAERECLHMDITQFNTSAYSHIHFAFATIAQDFKVNVSGVRDQFDKLKTTDLKGVKKILSFGGWSFSTAHDSFPIFRNSVTPANRRTFAANVVEFLKQNPEIDGVDFDWEYPGARDIPGVDPGSPDEGPNYLDFLRTLRSIIPQGKSLSIAIPASYWYLRNFPVAEISNVVDYFIYMTYDLHGQWDYDNRWSNPGCPKGNCLRSHVNLTETINALSMVTKAGVPSYKLMLGVTSYGRSFRMADPTCSGPMCEFTSAPGKHWVSVAEPGICTGTEGYISDAEIAEIQRQADEMGSESEVMTWHETPTNSDMMTWNGNWVAYMSQATKDARVTLYSFLNFGGISDWAVDLQRYHAPPGSPDEVDYDDDTPVMVCKAEFTKLADVVDNINRGMPSYCWGQYVIQTLPAELDEVLAKYTTVADDYDGKFGYYQQYIKDIIDSKLDKWLYPIGSLSPAAGDSIAGKGMPYFDCTFRYYGDAGSLYEGPCPVPAGTVPLSTWTFADWELDMRLRDEPGFYKALQDDLGIQREWIRWGKRDIGTKCGAGTPKDCSPLFQVFRNFPLKADDDKIKVPNPKDIMTRALANVTQLRTALLAAELSIGTSMYDGDKLDAARALSTPIFMLAQAVESMESIKEIGAKIEEEKKKALILLVVSLCLMIVPMLGEIGFELAGLVNLARFAFIAGEVGNAAMSLVDVVGNPEAAPFAVMGMVLGFAGRGIKFERALDDAGAARRLMSQADVDGMGATFKKKSAMVSAVVDRCVAF